jgi:hypothetical protein
VGYHHGHGHWRLPDLLYHHDSHGLEGLFPLHDRGGYQNC